MLDSAQGFSLKSEVCVHGFGHGAPKSIEHQPYWFVEEAGPRKRVHPVGLIVLADRDARSPDQGRRECLPELTPLE